MARTREITCEHYICEGRSALGKDGTFRKQCQICKSYKKKAGGRSARTDNRVQKRDKQDRRELRKEMY